MHCNVAEKQTRRDETYYNEICWTKYIELALIKSNWVQRVILSDNLVKKKASI